MAGVRMAKGLPSEQMAQVVEKTGQPVVLKEIPAQQPGPDEILINIKYSGVCHTDLHAVNGDWPLATKLPLVGRHEGAGIVVGIGSLVEDWDLGDHAGIKWINGTCLQCSFCQQSEEPLCAKAHLSGYTVDGTFQQYCLAKAAHAARIPKECDLEAIAPILCAGITVYEGLKESGARPGQTVAIVGAGGGLGSLACQYAKGMGLRVLAIDGGDEKKAMTTKLGAEHFVDFFDQQGRCFRVFPSKGCCRRIGLPAGAYFRAPVFKSVIRMITIKGSYVGNRRDAAEAIEIFRRDMIKAPFKTFGLSDLQKVYDLMHDGKITGRYVVDTSK